MTTTVAAFLILAVLLVAIWPDPIHMGRASHGHSDTKRARVLIVVLSWVFVALAAWLLTGGRAHEAAKRVGWFPVALTGCWLIPGIWAMERTRSFVEGCMALFFGPVLVCAASLAGLVRALR